jgi:spermidine synthase
MAVPPDTSSMSRVCVGKPGECMTDRERPRIEELDWQQTPMGELLLRRRLEPVTGEDVYEVRLGEEYLMSSAFTVAERELANRALDMVRREDLRVLVGGLGLGYTAAEALRDRRVRELVVVEALGAVIDWHARHLLPASESVAADPRCRMVEGDFFALARSESLTGAGGPDEPYDAILLDVDHTPTHHLDPSHADLYTEAGLRRLKTALRRGGVFGLWSDESAGSGFHDLLDVVFTGVEEHEVTFSNPLTGGISSNTIYLARA